MTQMRTHQREGRYVQANGIDIHYGEPLLLLNNAMVSANPVWASLPSPTPRSRERWRSTSG